MHVSASAHACVITKRGAMWPVLEHAAHEDLRLYQLQLLYRLVSDKPSL